MTAPTLQNGYRDTRDDPAGIKDSTGRFSTTDARALGSVGEKIYDNGDIATFYQYNYVEYMHTRSDGAISKSFMVIGIPELTPLQWADNRNATLVAQEQPQPDLILSGTDDSDNDDDVVYGPSLPGGEDDELNLIIPETVDSGDSDDEVFGPPLPGGEDDDLNLIIPETVDSGDNDDDVFGPPLPDNDDADEEETAQDDLSGDNFLEGTESDDFLLGGGGNDVLLGGSGADRLYGGRSIVDVRDGNDTIRGEAGNDLLLGNSGDDELFAHQGEDNIFGGRGHDTIYGGTGDDLLAGGGGIAHAADEADTIYGGTGGDVIVGNGGDDIIYAGHDESGGADTQSNAVFGGFGDDTIFGDGGNDVLIGQFGDDNLTGNGGADTFLFRAGSGLDTITDFESGEDRLYIDIAGFDSFSDLSITNVGDSLILSMYQGQAILLQDVSDLSFRDVVFGDSDPVYDAAIETYVDLSISFV